MLPVHKEGETVMKNVLIAGVTAVVVALIASTGCRVKDEALPPPAELVSLSLRPAEPSIAPGTTLQLEAIGNFSNNSTTILTNVTWESADTGIATVSSAGIVTAADLASAASTTITARSGAISGSAVLTVSPLVSLTVTPADQTIAGGTTIQFSALGTLQNGASQDLTSFVTWTSSNVAIATVSAAGLASTGTATTGTTTITASRGAISGPTTLTSAAVTSIAVTPASASIALGTSQQFTATGTLTGGLTQNLTTFALWSSSAPSVATVGNVAGTFGLAESKATGTTSILASFGTVTSAPPAVLTVTPATLVSISVAPTTTSVAAGNKLQYTATGAFSDSTTQDLTASATWASSNTQVATISNATGTRGLVSTLAQGTTTITATQSGITSNRATLTVTPPVLVSMTISPSNLTISLAVSLGVQQFTATGLISDGTTTNLTSSATWQSSNTAVASMDPLSKGLAHLLSVNTTTISATSGAITGTTLLTVTP